jgi:hypothetical protein
MLKKVLLFPRRWLQMGGAGILLDHLPLGR